MPIIPKPQPKIHPHFLEFARMELASCDFDAEHPMIIHICERCQLDLEHRLWLCFLYMAFYDEASMWVTYNMTDPFTVPPQECLELPIGKNRRNLYGQSIHRHFVDLCRIKYSIEGWPLQDYGKDPHQNWQSLKDNIGSVWGNGRFATFTTAELIQKVLKINIEVNGLDNKGSSGPADGIARAFYCDKKSIPQLDQYGLEGFQLLKDLGMKPTYTDFDMGVVESIYCTFGATCRGKFYPGRNVDRQQSRIMVVEEQGYDLSYLWEVRSKTIDHKFLGERNNWDGIDKDRLTLYRNEGILQWPHENR